MKKKILTKLMSLTLALATTLTLTACGGGAGSDAGSGSSASVSEDQSILSPDLSESAGDQVSDSDGDTSPQAQSITLSQLLSSGETILYQVTGSYDYDLERPVLGDDCTVKVILVTEPDGSFYQMNPDIHLNELSQMSDEEIVEMVKEGHKYSFNFSIFSDVPESGTDMMSYSLLIFLKSRLGFEVSNCLWSDGTNQPKYDYPPNLPAELTALIDTYIGHINSYYVDCPELETIASGYADKLNLGLKVENILSTDWENESESSLEEYIAANFPESCQARTLQLYNDCSADIAAIVEYINGTEPVPGQYRLMLKTGEDGVPYLYFVGRISNLFGSEELGTTEILNTNISLALDTRLGGRYQLAGSEYSGLSVINASFNPFLLVKGSYDFSLEQPGTSDLPVDVEPEELFA